MVNRATVISRAVTPAILAAIAVTVTLHGQPASDQVEIDAVVVDSHGEAVEGLGQEDFQVRDDGAAMRLDSFAEIGGGGQAATRIVVLLLDDTAVRTELTTRVQNIARSFVSRIAPGDRVNVVRLNHRDDEAAGDRTVTLARIGEFRAGMIPFFGRETFENALTKVARLSRQLEAVEHRRKSIVAIGSPGVFDVREPVQMRSSLLWPYWVDAIAAAARANATVSVIDPNGVSGRLRVTSSYGLVRQTGGDTLYNSAAFDAAVAQIWRDAAHYYLLGYTPAPSNRDLHRVEVTVPRRDVQVRARISRG